MLLYWSPPSCLPVYQKGNLLNHRIFCRLQRRRQSCKFINRQPSSMTMTSILIRGTRRIDWRGFKFFPPSLSLRKHFLSIVLQLQFPSWLLPSQLPSSSKRLRSLDVPKVLVLTLKQFLFFPSSRYPYFSGDTLTYYFVVPNDATDSPPSLYRFLHENNQCHSQIHHARHKYFTMGLLPFRMS